MQISRRFLLACIATAILFPSVLQAQDTEAQRKAREALEATIKATEGQPPAAELVPIAPAPETKPAVPPPAAVQPAKSQPAASDSAPAMKAPPAPPAASADAIERAREALRQKMGEPVTVQVPPVKASAPSPSKAEAKAAAKAENEMVKTDAKVDAAIQQAVVESEKAAVEKAQAEKAAAAQAQAEGKPVVAKTSKVKTTEPVAAKPQALQLQPMQGPPTGFAASKEQRLHDLLEQYKADNLTAEQYHAQRAKILAEP